MNKRLSFIPNASASGTATAVREFTACMDSLQLAHRCAVRMIKAVNRFGFTKIYYELVKETTNDK